MIIANSINKTRVQYSIHRFNSNCITQWTLWYHPYDRLVILWMSECITHRRRQPQRPTVLGGVNPLDYSCSYRRQTSLVVEVPRCQYPITPRKVTESSWFQHALNMFFKQALAYVPCEHTVVQWVWDCEMGQCLRPDNCSRLMLGHFRR